MVDPSGATVNPIAALDAATRLPEPIDPTGVEDAPDALPRIAGDDRIGTAIEASRLGWPSGSLSVVIAASGEYAEALPAAVLAAQHEAPLLLAGPGSDERVLTELRRLGAARASVVGSVPLSVDARLAGMGLEVVRIGGGSDVVGTAKELARRFSSPPGVLVVNKDSFPDGISAASIGARSGQPILLTNRDRIPQATVDAWRALGEPPVTVFGGTAVIGDNVARFFRAGRIAGLDRYGTSLAAARHLVGSGGAAPNLLVATGRAYPDALAAAPLARRTNAVTLLVDGTSGALTEETSQWLRASGVTAETVRVLGGAVAVTRSATVAIARILG
jgi:putative cell wall-binding protein